MQNCSVLDRIVETGIAYLHSVSSDSDSDSQRENATATGLENESQKLGLGDAEEKRVDAGKSKPLKDRIKKSRIDEVCSSS
jgi:hypothetical protein